jgi:hypothetical protein
MIERRDVPLYPAKNGGVRDADAPLGHHLDEIPIAKSIREVPSYA